MDEPSPRLHFTRILPKRGGLEIVFNQQLLPRWCRNHEAGVPCLWYGIRRVLREVDLHPDQRHQCWISLGEQGKAWSKQYESRYHGALSNSNLTGVQRKLEMINELEEWPWTMLNGMAGRLHGMGGHICMAWTGTSLTCFLQPQPTRSIVSILKLSTLILITQPQCVQPHPTGIG
ncbi:hypothetical protein HS088_TW15G00091 [Tripterygium wilfordii]|uniref:Uncharacterized protein n=1 Tax=Tripterygium wilfordii TaxID=458696 RepID=A0A7J7CKN4_TRIWF|nr:hypothetical protein HS088_TW15G00091 [Tripterygium wilfordii]